MNENFRIIVEEDKFNISIQGELDILTTTYLKNILEQTIDSFESDITIDFDKLVYIDSCGIEALQMALLIMRQKGLNMHLINAKKNVKKLFKIANSYSDYTIAV